MNWERVLVLMNPQAGSAGQERVVRQALAAELPNADVRTTTSAEEATELAAAAVAKRPTLVVAAGGDGTVNAVVNGLATNLPNACLGILPLGTGNDLSGTLAMPDEGEEAVRMLARANTRALDLVRAETQQLSRWWINMATGGNSGQVSHEVDAGVKRTWGQFSYVRGAAAVLSDLEIFNVGLQLDDGPLERFDAANLVIANGRTAAGRIELAPRANLEDGLLDVIVILDCGLLDVMALAAKYLVGDYLEDERIIYRQARKVYIESDPPIGFSIDGDLCAEEPITFTVMPRALNVVVGEAYVTQPTE